MIVHKMQQGSHEWFDIKCGKISASNISAVMAKGQGKTRRAYMLRIIAERLSGIPQETYINGAMQWGIETESLAREAYEIDTQNVVEQVGFIEVDEFLGCSPDGTIDLDGGCEIKCPNTTTHIEYMLDNKLPSVYVPQVQGTLWMTKREWWDFISFDPRLTTRPLWYIRVHRDEKKIKEIEIEVKLFIEEMLELESKIKGVRE